MFKKIKHGLKEVKQFVDKKIQMVKDVISDKHNRFTAGVIIIGISTGIGLLGLGIGGGLIASACIQPPI